MTRLTPRERKLVAVGLLVLAVAVIWLGLIAPVVGGFARRAVERRELISTYERNQRLLAAAPGWRVQAEMLKRTSAAYAISAASQGQAQELLDQRLMASTTHDGGRMPVVQDLQGDLPSGWIGARADAQLTLPQLIASLRRLENEEPYVVVQHLSISAGQVPSGPLDVRLEVMAAFRASVPGQS
jgi:general secretion pathway protein M